MYEGSEVETVLLVTGITGHTGKYFLQELINYKYQGPIRCIVRESSDTSLIDNSGLRIEKVFGDLSDREFINSTMVGVEQVMHIYNIHHSPIIVEAAINNEVERVILVHTTGIYSKFKEASEGYKKVENQLLKITTSPHCSTSLTILRPSMIYGDTCDRNISKFIKMIDKLRIIPVIDGGQSLIQPVNARDLGKAYYLVLMSPNETAGETYDLTGKEPIKMIDVFKKISKELSKRTIFISIPLNMGVIIAKLLSSLTGGRVNFIEKVQRLGENRSYSHKKASNDFGFKPMSFDEGLKIEVQEYLRNVKE